MVVNNAWSHPGQLHHTSCYEVACNYHMPLGGRGQDQPLLLTNSEREHLLLAQSALQKPDEQAWHVRLEPAGHRLTCALRHVQHTTTSEADTIRHARSPTTTSMWRTQCSSTQPRHPRSPSTSRLSILLFQHRCAHSTLTLPIRSVTQVGCFVFPHPHRDATVDTYVYRYSNDRTTLVPNSHDQLYFVHARSINSFSTLTLISLMPQYRTDVKRWSPEEDLCGCTHTSQHIRL